MPKFQIQIPEPCNEDWSLMTPTEKGRFCASCKKNVIDYTNTSDIELARIIYQKGKICGRFKENQLNKDLILPKSNSIQKLGYFFSIASFLGITSPLASQNQKQKTEKATFIKSQKTVTKITSIKDSITLKGFIIDEAGFLPGVRVNIIDSNYTTETNFDGYFEINIPKKLINRNVEFVFIGLKKKTVSVKSIVTSKDFRVNLKEDKSLEQEVVITGGICIKKHNPLSIKRLKDTIYKKK